MSLTPQPLTPDDVAALGRRLELQLPTAYVDALLHYPFPLDSELAEVVFFPAPAKIFQQNDLYRKEGFFGHAWPKHYLIIGGMGNGDVIFLDTSREAPAVLVADHELSSGADRMAIDAWYGGMLLPEWLKDVMEGWQEARKWESENQSE